MNANQMDGRRVGMLSDQKDCEFYFDGAQAEKVFGALIERLRAKGRPYNDAHVPQAEHLLPKNLEKQSRAHAVFLFMLCFWMRGGTDSSTAEIFLARMYEGCPKAFTPELYLSEGSQDENKKRTEDQIKEISDLLKQYGMGQRLEENSSGWVYNMRKLARFWGGDPRRLMDDSPSFKVLEKRIKWKKSGGKKDKNIVFGHENDPFGFMYFQEKMTAMIAYFLMDSRLVRMFYTPVPVDFHVLRLLTANLVIKVKDRSVEDTIGINFYRPAVLKLCREVTEWYCRKEKISPIALCDSLWLLSRTLCRNNPGNSGYVVDLKRKADIRERKQDLYDGELLDDMPPDDVIPEEFRGRKKYKGLKWGLNDIWNKARIRRFHRTCGVCPLSAICCFNVPSGAYYVAGALLPERHRAVPPDDGQGHFLATDAFGHTVKPRVDPTVRFARIEFPSEKENVVI